MKNKVHFALGWLIYFILFFKFTEHIFGALFWHSNSSQHSTWFVEAFQLDSDMLVRERIDTNLTSGIFHSHFFIGKDASYLSQIGIGGWLLSLPVTLLTYLYLLPRNATYAAPIDASFQGNFLGLTLTYAVVALINAYIYAMLLRFIWQRFGRIQALAFFVLSIQPWSLAINGSIYWFISFKFIPCAALVYAMKQNFSKSKRLLLVVLGFIVSFSAGFEFATLSLAVTMATYYFLYSEDFTNILQAFKSMGILVLTSIFSLIFTLSLQLYFLILNHENFNSALQLIAETIVKRTGASNMNVPLEFRDSLKTDPVNVIHQYFGMPILGSPYSVPILKYFTVYVFFFLIFIVTIFTSETSKKILSLQFWLLSSLGPIAWYLLARPHAAGHTHIDFAIWYLPTLPLGFCLIIERIRNSHLVLPVKKVVITWIGYLGFIFLMFAVSYATLK